MNRRRALARAGFVLLATLGSALAAPRALPEPAPAAVREVVFAAGDKVKIAAAYHAAGGPGGPAVVLLPMFRSERTSWDPAVEPLLARGVSVLAVDPRGHGRSAALGAKDLVAKVERRDPTVFASMHLDAIAGVRWLVKEAGCDPKRIVLAGAAVGGSVALDTAARHPSEVAGVLWLSPGPKFLGLDSLAHAKAAPATLPLMLLAHASDQEGARKIHDLRPSARLMILDEPRPDEAGAERAWAQGTRMLEHVPFVAQTIASHVAVASGSTSEDVVLDGIVTTTGPNADPWDRAIDVGPPGGIGSVRAFRVGRRLLFGGTAPPGATGLVFEVQTGDKEEQSEGITFLGPPQVVGADLATSRVTWSFGGMGSVPAFPGLDMGPLFGKTMPAIRAVVTDAGTTFEGEWMIPKFGGESKLIRLFVGVLERPPTAPRDGMVTSYTQHAVDLPSR